MENGKVSLIKLVGYGFNNEKNNNLNKISAWDFWKWLFDWTCEQSSARRNKILLMNSTNYSELCKSYPGFQNLAAFERVWIGTNFQQFFRRFDYNKKDQKLLSICYGIRLQITKHAIWSSIDFFIITDSCIVNIRWNKLV